MKKSIGIYLIILVVLTNIFTYVFLSSQVKFEQKRSDNLDKKFVDTIKSFEIKINEANYFSLEKNDKAQDYFENKTTGKFIAFEKLIPFVTDKLLDLNNNPNGNPFTGYEKINDKPFIINKVKVLNHRWIIADFNNGSMWGEVLLKYFVNPDETVDFEISETLIYSN